MEYSDVIISSVEIFDHTAKKWIQGKEVFLNRNQMQNKICTIYVKKNSRMNSEN